MNAENFLPPFFFEEFKAALPLVFDMDAKPNGFESTQMVESRRLEELKSMLGVYVEYFVQGYDFFINHPDITCKEKLAAFVTEEGLERIGEYFEGGDYCLRHPLHISNEEISVLYAIATKTFDSEPLVALNLYTTLLFFDLTFPEFWIGLALSTRVGTGNLAETEKIYKCALSLNPNSSVLNYYYGEFLASLNDSRAGMYLEKAKELESTSNK